MSDASAPQEEARMTLAEHLTELRTRLLRCVIAALVLGVGSLVFAKFIYGILIRPVLVSLPPEAAQLVYTSAIEEINVYMKVGLYAGIFLATPVILWQIWGFVSPGLYPSERKMAAPFVAAGTLAFITGVLFCYFVLLPTMFKFLLKEEGLQALEGQIGLAKLQEESALRWLRLGELSMAGQVAKDAAEALESSADPGVKLVDKPSVEVRERLFGLGRMIDAVASTLEPARRATLKGAIEKHQAAAEAFAREDLTTSLALIDEGAAALATATPNGATDLSQLWRLERGLAQNEASKAAANWTRPMLSMNEQLTLVLVLLLAFGVIFELPLVLALLGMVGLVKASFLMRYQRHAVVVCLILAAVITPTGDVVNLSMMAGPILLCYELGVLAVWIIEKRRARLAATTSITPAQ